MRRAAASTQRLGRWVVVGIVVVRRVAKGGSASPEVVPKWRVDDRSVCVCMCVKRKECRTSLLFLCKSCSCLRVDREGDKV